MVSNADVLRDEKLGKPYDAVDKVDSDPSDGCSGVCPKNAAPLVRVPTVSVPGPSGMGAPTATDSDVNLDCGCASSASVT